MATTLEDIHKMLQAVISGLSTLRMEMQGGFKTVNKRIDKVEERLDKIGQQVAYLEDDAPTREEFENLEKKVLRISP